MITLSDTANIMYRDCSVFGVERVPFGRTVTGQLKEERCVIHIKERQYGKYWTDGFVEVNLCVPDKAPLYTEADTPRIEELLRLAHPWKDGVAGVWDGTPYYYETQSEAILTDTALRCHYANVKVLFKVLNVME